MQLCLAAFGALIAAAFGCADPFLMPMRLGRKNAVAFLLVLVVCTLFPLGLEAGFVRIDVCGTLLSIVGFCFLFFAAPGGWERYRCAVCVCIITAAAYLLALYFPEEADALLDEAVFWAAAVSAALGFLCCRSECGAAACAIACEWAIPTAVSFAHHVSYDSTPVCCVDAILMIDALIGVGGIFTALAAAGNRTGAMRVKP